MPHSGAVLATIAFIGDSHAEALWPRVEKRIAGTGYEVVLKEANRGWSEASYRSKKPTLPATLAAARPDVVVIEIGGNAQPSGGEDKYRSDVEWLVSAAKAAGAGRILWFGPATSDANIAAETASRHDWAAEMQRAILPALGVEWYDSRPTTLTGQRSDGVHFDSSAYDRWAAEIAARILAPATKSTTLTGLPKAALVSGAVALSALLVVLTLRFRKRL